MEWLEPEALELNPPSPFHTWTGTQWELVNGGLRESLKAEIVVVETNYPVTQRALREYMLAYNEIATRNANALKAILVALGPALDAPTRTAINAQMDQIISVAAISSQKIQAVEALILPLRQQLPP